jgi:telomeric repeat-binding factor 2
VLPRRKHIACHKRSKGGGVKITEEVDTDASCSKYDSLPTPEVNRIKEALKSSTLELQAVVKDPFPDALHLAESVISDMVKKDKTHKPSVENQSGKDIDALNPSVDKSVAAQTTNPSCGNQSCIPQSNAPRPSLMERNGTARCYEVPVVKFCCFNLLVCFQFMS